MKPHSKTQYRKAKKQENTNENMPKVMLCIGNPSNLGYTTHRTQALKITRTHQSEKKKDWKTLRIKTKKLNQSPQQTPQSLPHHHEGVPLEDSKIHWAGPLRGSEDALGSVKPILVTPCSLGFWVKWPSQGLPQKGFFCVFVYRISILNSKSPFCWRLFGFFTLCTCGALAQEKSFPG